MHKQIEKEIAKLRALGIENPGFKAPSNYFEEFSNTLFTRIQEEQIPQKTGFITPESYFIDIEETILSRIDFQKKRNHTKIRILYTITTVAAAIILYFGLSEYQQPATVSFDSLTTVDIENWIISGNMNIDSYDIVSIGAENVWSSNLEMDKISNEEINNYLDTVEPEFLFIEN